MPQHTGHTLLCTHYESLQLPFPTTSVLGPGTREWAMGCTRCSLRLAMRGECSLDSGADTQDKKEKKKKETKREKITGRRFTSCTLRALCTEYERRRLELLTFLPALPLSYLSFNAAVALLKVGGLMVYSTCSLNPVENEAVVAEVRAGTWVEGEEIPLERAPGDPLGASRSLCALVRLWCAAAAPGPDPGLPAVCPWWWWCTCGVPPSAVFRFCAGAGAAWSSWTAAACCLS